MSAVTLCVRCAGYGGWNTVVIPAISTGLARALMAEADACLA